MSERALFPGDGNLLVREPEKFQRVLKHSKKPQVLLSPGELDRAYLPVLFAGLSKDNSSMEARVSATLKATFILASWINDHSALIIDESGYFLTSGDALRKIAQEGSNQPLTAVMYHPKENIIIPIKTAYISQEHDIGLAFAPTGLPQNPWKKIQLDLDPVRPHAYAHFGSYYTYRQEEVNRKEIGYAFDEGVILPNVIDEALDPKEDFIMVDGMRPFNGSIGAPVRGYDAKTIGILSGYYPEESSSRQAVKGSLITPITYVNDLLGKRSERFDLVVPRKPIFFV